MFRKMHMTKFFTVLLSLTGALWIPLSFADDSAFKAMMGSSFQPIGIATLERLVQDENQLACSNVKKDQLQLSDALKSRIEKNNLQAVVLPSDQQYFGKAAKDRLGATRVMTSMAGVATTVISSTRRKFLMAISARLCTTMAS